MKSKRLFTFVTAVVMMFSVCTTLPMKISVPLEVSAAYENTHTNTGNQRADIVAIAQTQVGYHEGSLEGTTNGSDNYTKYNKELYAIDGSYKYMWCQSFIAWCAKQAGVSSSVIKRTAGTVDAMDFFKAQGVWQGRNYTPQSGDIIYFTSSSSNSGYHVGIVESVSGSTINTIEGNYSNKVARHSVTVGSSSIVGYGVPNYSNPNPPTYSNLTANKTMLAIGDEITFTASSDYATGFSIGIDNKDGRYVTQEMSNGQLTLTFNEAGSYGAYVTSYNSAGYVDSNWISFIVYDTMPMSSELVADKYIAKVGEEITFTASSDLASAYWMGIDNKSGRYLTQEMPNGQLTLTFNEAGSYGAYVTSLNSLGYVDSKWINFIIYDSAPTYSILDADKVKVAVGEEITFTASSDFASAYWIGIDNETERYTTQEMYNGKLTLTFDKTGNYGAYVTSLNALGYVDSKWIEFTVYDKSPTYGKLESEWGQYKFVVGDTIPLVATSDLATEYWLGFDKGSERIITEEMQNGRHSVVVTEAGEYSAYVSVANKYGGIDSDRIYFSVYDKAPTFGTLEIINEKTTYFVGDTIRFKANSDYASEYWIGIDKDKERIITDSMQDAVYELTLTETGEYSAYVSVANGLGGLDSKSVNFKVYHKSELQGDVNCDGEVNVADAVMLQKWLLGSGNLTNWENVDLCKDGRIDVFDMIEMRKLIVKK